MTITGTDLGKKFEGHWIFRGISVDIHSGEKVAITGPNGSGKSTLLQILTSALTPSTGKLEYHHGDFFIPEEEARHHINFCSPYSNLVEEFTLVEYLKFHGKFKAPLLEYDEMTDRMELSNHLRKPIGQFSSGMKQRVKLSLQFFYEGAILALDEPTNNLDEKGHAWYRSEIISQSESRTILVASNHRSEYEFCTKTIDLSKA